MSPFTVLHVCMGNICRSPMAERLLAKAVAEAAAPMAGSALIHSHSVGTGGWHAGEPMHPSAARQVRARGGDPTGFTARQLRPAHVAAADLVLVATVDQQLHVASLVPEAVSRTFLLGECERLLPRVPAGTLPPPARDPAGVHARGLALVAALDAVRGGAAARPEDDLDDPWGRGEKLFVRVADRIEATVRPLVAALLAPAERVPDPAS